MPCEILDLAQAYDQAARILLAAAFKRNPLTCAPARMTAIHAIELYVNAFLRFEGAAASAVRGRLHELYDPDLVSTLKIRVKTARHLKALVERREYLVCRYGPEQMSGQTEVNRLLATLEEIGSKVRRHVYGGTIDGHTRAATSNIS